MRVLWSVGQVAALVVVALSLSCVSPAYAAVGVGTNVASIEVTETLLTGGTYRLPAFAIINTGTGQMSYEMVVGRIEGERAPDPLWFKFSPKAFTLSARLGENIETEVTIPPDAAPGAYKVRVGGRTVQQVLTDGAMVGAAAGPVVSFVVAKPTPLQKIAILFDAWMPWSALLLAFALSLVAFVAYAWINRSHKSVEQVPDE